jgi:Ran GTPase-activating protein (RanGAP) involved in mRNA processing and transport
MRVSDPGAAAVANALLSHTSLARLDLSYNNIHNDGASALANAIKANKYLNYLNLSHNPISADGLKALIEAIKANEDLKEVALDGITLDRAMTAAMVTLAISRSVSFSLLLCVRLTDQSGPQAVL